MVEYEDCFIDDKGKLRIGVKVKEITGIRFIDRLLSKEPIPKITLTKKEAKEKNINYKENPKGFFVTSEEGIRIPVDVI